MILALGHANYGRMALNLAISIKGKGWETNICLLHSHKMLDNFSPNERSFFDQYVMVDESMYTHNGAIEYQMAKTSIYDLSPYDNTVYLDADSIWLAENNPKELFGLCKNNPVLFQCVHKWDIQDEWGCLWTCRDGLPNEGLKQIREIYGITDNRTIYEMQSSFLYFEKGIVARNFFDTAKKLYTERPFHFWTWNNGMPDELVFNISTALNNIKLPLFPFTPLFFDDYTRTFKGDTKRECTYSKRDTIFNKYFALSMAGNTNSTSVTNLYDDMVKMAYSRFMSKVRFPWLWKQKKQFITTRIAA